MNLSRFFSLRLSLLFLHTFVLALAFTGCGYERAQVTLVGTPATAKGDTFEPAILDQSPSGNVKIVATASKSYRDVSWATDACRDLGCDAVVIIASKPRQVANFIQMNASSGNASSSGTQTHTVYDQYDYQFIVLP